MKKTGMLFTLIVICLLSFVVPTLADEVATPEVSEQQVQQKNECLLRAKSCGNSIISIQDKIERLKEEIAKGRAVYSAEELENLKQKMDDVSRTLDFLLER